MCCVYFFQQKISRPILSRKQTENLKITLESKIALGVRQKLVPFEQQTSLLTTMEFLFNGTQIFPQTAMRPFMLAVLDHRALASLNYTLSVSEYVTTNVTAKPDTFLHETNHGCTVVSHMCSCNTPTVTRT